MSAKRPATALYQTAVIQRLSALAPTLPPALRKVADFILRHPLKAATLTIEEVARQTATSPAAVNRLARAAEFGGFSGLKTALRATLHDYVAPVDKLRGQLAEDASGRFDLGAQLHVSQRNLEATAKANSPEAFEAAVSCLAQSKKVYTLGFGNSVYLAAYAAANLVPFCPDAVAVSMEGGNENAAYRLATIGPGDVLLAISLPRYTLDTVHLARFAVARGAKVVALSDSPAAPLQSVAHHMLYSSMEHPVMITSNIAAFAVIESLIAAVMVRNHQAAALAAEQSECVMAYLHVADPGSL